MTTLTVLGVLAGPAGLTAGYLLGRRRTPSHRCLLCQHHPTAHCGVLCPACRDRMWRSTMRLAQREAARDEYIDQSVAELAADLDRMDRGQP